MQCEQMMLAGEAMARVDWARHIGPCMPDYTAWARS